MEIKSKSYSRLTIIFVLSILIPGGILAYFSIQNIANQKELTEKLIIEEEKEIYGLINNSFDQQLDKTSKSFLNLLTQNQFNLSLLSKSSDSINFVETPFVVNEAQEFILPAYQFKSNIPKVKRIINSLFQKKYNVAQNYEFNNLSYSKSNYHYKEALKFSNNKNDSARAINALARLSVKYKKFDIAQKYYNILLTEYFEVSDNYGFPYPYYSIQQILKLSVSFNSDWIIEKNNFILNKIIAGKIIINNSTSDLISSIENWMVSRDGLDSESIEMINLGIKKISNQIYFVENNNIQIKKFLNNVNDYSTQQLNNCYLIPSSNSQKKILLYKLNDLYYGIVVNVSDISDSINKLNFGNNTEFEYMIETEIINKNRLLTDAYTFSAPYSTFTPDLLMSIKLRVKNSLNDHIRSSNWILGITISLLIGGMILGIVLIVRDIAREKYLSKLKSDFVANVSHELKTPLTSIHLFVEAILSGHINKTTDQKEYLGIILKETERLKRLINNILSFSKSENDKKKYVKTVCNISEVVESAIRDLDYWLIEKKFKVITEIEKDIKVFAESDAMKQAVINLLTNAMNYSYDTKEIRISLEKKKNEVILEVEDKGIGIDETQIDRIFEKFYRIYNKDNPYSQGTGLGLSVVKEIVDEHNGSISVESKIKQGSKFIIQLDLV